MMTCASAWAESSASLYGLVGLDIASTRRSDGPPRSFAEQSPGLSAPFWGLRITEEPGGGYRVVAALESFFQPVNGGTGRTSADPLWGRNAYVGIAGPFGTVTLGRQTTLLYLATQAVNPFQASVLFSPLVMQTFTAPYGGAVVGDTVWNNAIQYRTPGINGLTVTTVFAPGGVAGSGGTFNAGLSALYANGALTAVATVQRTRFVAGVAAPTQIAYIAGAAYDFSLFKLYGALQRTRTDAIDLATKTYEAGLAIPITAAFSILAEWAYTHRSVAGGVTTARNTATAGVDYFLSKRTDVYLLSVYDRLEGRATAMTFATGIRHSF